MCYTTEYNAPFGKLILSCDGERLTGLWIEGQKYFGGSKVKEMTVKDDIAVFHQVKGWLARYFAGKQPGLTELPLAPAGGEFRQAVWRVLRKVPYGQVITYGAIGEIIAGELGRENMSAQAVGGAVGHNPISIIIPCHRVVGAGGSLTGYAGGLDRKRWLLAHEGVDVERFSMPKRGTAL